MRRRLSDAVVVITGASSGIGRATALAFAQKGATVVLAARREEALRALARHCEGVGGRALAVPTDVTDEEAVKALARKAVETFGRIDVWVNNAAVTMFGRFDEVPIKDFRRVIETNFFGYVYGARAVLPIFRTRGSGVLINNSSMVGAVGQPYASAYVASKWAIRGLSESLRMELSLADAKDIHVCTLMPASIDTPLFQHGANYTGRAAKAMNPVYEAEMVAKQIVQLAEHPRREQFAGMAARVIAMQKTMAPELTERQLARQVDRDHFQDRPAPPSTGNLYEPDPHWTSISGGWRQPSSGGVAKVAVPLAAAAGGALVWFKLRWLAAPLLKAGALFGWLAFPPFRDRSGALLPFVKRRPRGVWRVVEPVTNAVGLPTPGGSRWTIGR